MKTTDFVRQNGACDDIAAWAMSISDEMSDVWDAMIEQKKHKWLIWTATRPNVFSDATLRKLACRFVLEIPLGDGRTMWDLLTDERSCTAIKVAEAHADGKATDEELKAALAPARAAYTDRIAPCVAIGIGIGIGTGIVIGIGTGIGIGIVIGAAIIVGTFTMAAYASAAEAAAHAAAHVVAYDARLAVFPIANCAVCAVRAVRAADSAYAAKSAQVKMMAELGNPFRKENDNE